VAEAIRAQYPGCPAEEAASIAAWTCRKHSGRVGRSAAAKRLEPHALRLAVIAHIRHGHTDYDERLMQGDERGLARLAVAGKIEAVLGRWTARRQEDVPGLPAAGRATDMLRP